MAQESTAVESVAERAKKAAADAQAVATDTANTMTTMVRRVLLAAVGAVVVTKEEIEDFVDKLVERGEIAEQEGRKLVSDVLARRRSETEKVAEKVGEKVGDELSKAEAMLDERIEGILSRLNVPTRSDIDALSEKISALAAKVDALKGS